MLDKLISLVQQQAGQDIVQNPAIPNQFNNQAIETVGQEIFKGLQGQVSQGNIQQMASMFTGGGGMSSLQGNPMVTQIVGNVASSFASKFGISPSVAQSVAMAIVPKVLNQFVNKTNDPKDNDFDLQDMVRQFGGSGNIGDLLGKFGGGSGNTGGIGGALGKMFGG